MNRPSITWRDRLRYRFENTLSRGTIAIIGWLAVLSLVIVALSAVAIVVLRLPQDPADLGSVPSFIEGMWQSLMHALDAGNLAGDQGWGLRVLMGLVTLGGIFIVSSLIGTITSGLQNRLDELRKGRSRVIETGHILIVGWNSKIFSIISELIIANQNQLKPRVVVLAERDKVEMEDELRAKIPDMKNLRVICRSGDPLDIDDLQVVDPHAARAIIVLAPETQSPDIHVIKSVLAITNHPQRKADAYHIVAEIREEQNREAADLVGGAETVYVQGDELIARVTAQTCRQSGLSAVYTELLDFDGAEFYLKLEPALAGRSYREALGAYPTAAVVGLAHADGQVEINPPMTREIVATDQIIAIAEDDSTLQLGANAPPAPDLARVNHGARAAVEPERTLILGWNGKAQTIIRELDNYVSAGSEVTVLCLNDCAKAELDALNGMLKQQVVQLQRGAATRRAELDAIDVARFQHIIVLSDPDLPIQEADAQTLIALLHLRNIVESGGLKVSIVSEMMDLRNRALAQVAKADDFIVSDKLVSLLLSQLAENRQLDQVFRKLFGSEGAEIYIRPVADYVTLGESLNFYTLLEAAAQRGETAIGYRIASLANDAESAYGIRLNPNKSELISFSQADRLIVLAED